MDIVPQLPISAAVVFAVLMAIVSFAFWLGVLSSRVASHHKRIGKLEQADEAEGLRNTGLALAFARFEGTIMEKLENLSKELDWLRHPAGDKAPPPYVRKRL
jgi:hypothetical protein